MKITLDPFSFEEIESISTETILRAQDIMRKGLDFSLRFIYNEGSFTYCNDDFESISFCLIEEIIKLTRFIDHEFDVSGYPLLNVNMTEGGCVNFSLPDGTALDSGSTQNALDVINNMSSILKVLLLASPKRP